jgi:3-hydroxybutyryl-CoA dehydrogenase
MSAPQGPRPAFAAGEGIRSVGVVGAGTMGSGIAQLCLSAGHEVAFLDADPAALERGRERVRAGLGRLIEKGRLDDAGRERLLGNLRPVADIADLVAAADIVIEAVVEDLDVKRALFRELDARCAAEVPLATNTSSLSVGAIAEAAARPSRVLGLHFFNPAPVMPLVEVVIAARTDPGVVERATSFVARLGRTPLACRDAPGFIVNRVGRPFVREALRLLEEGRADTAAIDAAVEAAGYPMGPLRLADLIGLDVELAITGVLHDSFGEASRFARSALLEQLVHAGRLGRKSGAGFYRYEHGSSLPVEALPLSLPSLREMPEMPSRLGTPASAPGAGPARGWASAGEIVERVELGVINEAYRAIGEGVAGPADIDLAMRLGAGHPSGPFARAGDLGLRRVVERLHVLHLEQRETSDQYEVAPLLWQMATV